MIKPGMYRIVKPHIVYENHGGANIKHEIFWILCFYQHSKEVGLFGADKEFIQPYLKKTFDLKGEITKSTDNFLELYVLNPYTKVRKIYSGRVEGDRLHLKYYHDDKPTEVFEDEFEYIGKGESQA